MGPLIRFLPGRLRVTGAIRRLIQSRNQTGNLSAGRTRVPATQLRGGSRSNLAVPRSVPWVGRFAYVIRATGSSFFGSRASCAAGCHRIRTT